MIFRIVTCFYLNFLIYLPIAGGIFGPHVDTARGVTGASSRLVRIHGRVHPFKY